MVKGGETGGGMRQKKRREIGEEERVTTRLFPLVPAYGASSLAFCCWSAFTTNHVACLTRYRLRIIDDTCRLLDNCEKMLRWKLNFDRFFSFFLWISIELNE